MIFWPLTSVGCYDLTSHLQRNISYMLPIKYNDQFRNPAQQ